MPNHVRNVWKISKIPEDKIDYVKNKLSMVYKAGEETHRIIDFDLIIPEPRLKRDCPRNCIVNKDSHVVEDMDRPWFDWYKWRNIYWNTKWGAYDGYTIIGKTYIQFVFSTAWSLAGPIVAKLHEFCSQQGFDLDIRYADEDYGSNCGWQQYDHTTDSWTTRDLKPNPSQWAKNLWNY